MYFSYRDTGGNPGKLCEWKSLHISVMELCVLKLRVQIWIKPLSEICGFLAVKGEHNRILAHMPCTSARSSECCQRQSVHHSPPTPFHNTDQKKTETHSIRVRPTNRRWGSESRRSRRMKCPHWLAAPLWSPLHSLPIDTWEISSRQRLILVIYSRRGCVATDEFLSSCSWLTRATRPARQGQSRTDRPAPPPRSDSLKPASQPPVVKPNRPLFLLIISYIIRPSSFDWLTFDLCTG